MENVFTLFYWFMDGEYLLNKSYPGLPAPRMEYFCNFLDNTRMNLAKLSILEQQFLDQHPDGFDGPEFADLEKKHKMRQHVAFAQQHFAPEALNDTEQVLKAYATLVGRSTMLSVFEKTAFRNWYQTLSSPYQDILTAGLALWLGNGHDGQPNPEEECGFSQVVDVLREFKLAKWPIVTVVPAYVRPTLDVCIKPTTAKNVIREMELDLVYSAQPTYGLYAGYRAAINQMKAMVHPSLAETNAHFGGFMMMTLG